MSARPHLDSQDGVCEGLGVGLQSVPGLCVGGQSVCGGGTSSAWRPLIGRSIPAAGFASTDTTFGCSSSPAAPAPASPPLASVAAPPITPAAPASPPLTQNSTPTSPAMADTPPCEESAGFWFGEDKASVMMAAV